MFTATPKPVKNKGVGGFNNVFIFPSEPFTGAGRAKNSLGATADITKLGAVEVLTAAHFTIERLLVLAASSVQVLAMFFSGEKL